MTIARFQTPDGRIARFEVPDGTTPEQAQVMMEKEFPNLVPSQPTEQTSQSGFSNFVRGVRELPQAIVDIPSTIASSLIAPPLSQAYGVGANLLSGKFGTQEGTQIADKARQQASDVLTYQPRSATVRTIKEMMGNVIEPIAPAFPALFGEMMAFSSTPKVPNIPAKPSVSTIKPEVAAAANKFHNMGGKILPHTLSDNKMVRATGDWLENLPISNSPNVANKVVINRQLLRQIGGDETAGLLTPESFSFAMDKSGATIGEMYGKVSVPLVGAGDLGKSLSDILKRQSKHTPDIGKQVGAYIDDIYKASENNKGSIPGSTVRELDSELGARIRQTTDGDLKGQLSDIQEALRDSLEVRLLPEDASVLRDARMKYAKGKLLEPLVAKFNIDGVPPSALISRQLATNGGRHRLATQAAGEMGDLAIIGNKFLKDTSTTRRNTITDAAAAIPGIVLGSTYNTIGPVIAKSKLKNALTVRELLGYEKPVKEGPGLSLAEGDNSWRFEKAFPGKSPSDSGLLSVGDMMRPQEPAQLQMGVIEPPQRLRTPQIETNTTNYAQQRRNQVMDAQIKAEQAQAAQEAANRLPTGRGTALEMSPQGVLRPEQTMRGATPDVISSTGHALDSAVGKLSRGEPATMTLLEKIAWDKRKVDLATLEPGMKTLSDSAIRGKMLDRQWVQDAITKARDKAAGFDAISKRATDAQKIRDAAASRERMLDLAGSLEEQLRGNNKFR